MNIRARSAFGMSILLLFTMVHRGDLRAKPFEDSTAKKRSDSGAAESATSRSTPEERIAALEEMVRMLQARVEELTSRSPGSSGPAKSDNAAASAGKTEFPSTQSQSSTLAAAGVATSSAAPAPPPVGNLHSFFDKMTFSGLVDTYYGFNFNQPENRTNSLRNFDVNHNQFSLNLLEFAMERQADPIGFRMDLDYGDTAKMVAASEPGGTSLYQFLQQAYVTYRAPLGKGLTLDFGKMVTQLGAEVIESPANYNYSRSLLFSWAIPYYHFGARLSYPVNDKVTFTGMVVNGWNDVVDNNGAKTVHLGVTLAPTRRLSIAQNYIVGAEQPGDDHDKRHVLDTVVTWSATDKLSLMANYDYGMDRVAGARDRYQGIAGYARYAISSRFAISPRLEWFTDPQGLATGFAQTLKEVTLTTEFKARSSMLVRAEYRTDWSDLPFFPRQSGALGRTQTTATLGLIYLMGQEH